MNAATLQSLLWILVWGGLFFLMMRFGCGAHIGGHGHHSRYRDGATGAEPVKDPVCGMSVNPRNAAAATVHSEKTYYFCSTSCRDKFEREPEKYLTGSSAHGGHHHG